MHNCDDYQSGAAEVLVELLIISLVMCDVSGWRGLRVKKLLLVNFRPRISRQGNFRQRREASRERFPVTSEPPRHREG